MNTAPDTKAKSESLSDADIEKLAVKHEAFGFGRVDAKGYTTHGFDPDGLRDFAAALLKLAAVRSLTAEQGGNLLVWADPPTYTSWGACMKEALLELDKDHTLRLFAEEDALELVAPALRAALTTQPQAEPADARIYWHAHQGWQVEWLTPAPDGGQSNYYRRATPTTPTEPT